MQTKKKGVFWTMAVVGAVPLLMGLTLPQCAGLNAKDFEQICVSGFDPADNAVDKNYYAWSMEYFVPDGATEGYLYVGTGNNISGLVGYGFTAFLAGLDPREGAPIRPPELRRYRPDLGPLEWERVLDYRDVETDPDWTTIGFRMMKTYRAQSDGVNYLYAATMGTYPKLWRTATGNPGDWEAVLELETGSIRWMEEHKGLLYLAFATDVPNTDLPRIGRIWATDGAAFWPVMEDGFGNPNNIEIECLVSYNGWLYAGTLNQTTGYEIWKFIGPAGDEAPVRIVANGGPDSRNDLAGTPKVFQGNLYMGSLIFQGGINMETLNGFKGCDIIRIDPNDNWQTIVGPGGLSGYTSGFNFFTNAYQWWMEEHDGWLYASTYDASGMYRSVLEYLPKLPELMGGLGGSKAGLLDAIEALQDDLSDMIWNRGADLYKSFDGVHWFEVTQDGLGDRNNYGIRTMKSVGPYLYLGTTNPKTGLEIWRSIPTTHAAE